MDDNFILETMLGVVLPVSGLLTAFMILGVAVNFILEEARYAWNRRHRYRFNWAAIRLAVAPFFHFACFVVAVIWSGRHSDSPYYWLITLGGVAPNLGFALWNVSAFGTQYGNLTWKQTFLKARNLKTV
jgi:hypothetical protein